MSRVIIVGSGVVGTATGKGFAKHGHNVEFVDIDPSRIDSLRRDGLDANDEIDLRGPDAYLFLTLPTPSTGEQFDLLPFRRGTEQVADALRDASGFHTIVSRSTVPPGTMTDLVEPILSRRSGGRSGEDYATASNPEFLRAACALEDFLSPRVTVFGTKAKRTSERLHDLYAPFGGQVVAFDDPVYAEFVKCAHNIFNATKISFWNEMWMVADRLGLDVSRVAPVVAGSAEASFNPQYGINGGAPYGGACLPKDTTGFLGYAASRGVDMPLLEATIDVNDRVDVQVNGEKTVLGRMAHPVHHDRVA